MTRWPLLTLLLLTACPATTSTPEVIVVHRCKDVNFDDLAGAFAKLEGGKNVTTKSRLLASRGASGLELAFVGKDQRPVRLSSDGAGPDRVTLTEAGSGRVRQMKGTITQDCRVQLEDGWLAGGSWTAVPDATYTFVPFGDAARLDYEPCTERLYRDGDAKNHAAAKRSEDPGDTIPVTRRSWTDVAAFGSGPAPRCKALVNVWVNGEAEVQDTIEVGSGPNARWHYRLDNGYVGTQAVSMRRYEECSGSKKLLGVACATYEVK